MTLDEQLGGPFATVLDVGGNVGDFAELAVTLWPDANVISFEPLPHIAAVNEHRAAGRWITVRAACSDRDGQAEMYYCINQHSASTLRQPGSARRDLFGIDDRWEQVEVNTLRLDYLTKPTKPILLKLDVEGHERTALEGAGLLLSHAACVICEVQNDPAVFGFRSVGAVDRLLSMYGLCFDGVLDVLHAPDGHVVQFDGIWQRP